MNKFTKKADLLATIRGDEQVVSAADWRADVKHIDARGVVKQLWTYTALQRRVARAAIEFEISSNILSDEEKEEWFASDYRKSNWPKYGPTVSIPYNFQNWPSRPILDETREEQRERQTSQFLRVAGWLRSASEFPTLVEFIRHTQGGIRGVNSPYTTVQLWDFIERHPSPGAAERYLKKVAYHTNRFLRGFNLRFGGRWSAIAWERRDPRKAGMATAASLVAGHLSRVCGGETTLWGRARDILVRARGLATGRRYPRETVLWAVERVNAGEFACLREALALSGRLVADSTDAVGLLLDPVQYWVKCGIAVTRGYRLEKHTTGHNGHQWHAPAATWLVVGHGRSFHIPSNGYDGSNDPKRGWMVALHAALDAWGKQKKLERENKEFLFRFHPGSFSTLVWFSDSLKAGNCRAGTEEFMRRVGIPVSLQFIPVTRLLPHAGDTRVMNVLKLVADKVAGFGI